MALALAVSIETIRAEAWGVRRTAMASMPSRSMSPT
jgi:hypothetical protein